MNNDLRTKAERLIATTKVRPKCYEHMSDDEYAAGVATMLDDLRLLAENDGCVAAAWALSFVDAVAEHRADDDEPVTEEWLESLGAEWRPSCTNAGCFTQWLGDEVWFGYFGNAETPTGIAGRSDSLELKTRRQVRRLCEVFGIELKGE